MAVARAIYVEKKAGSSPALPFLNLNVVYAQY
jgi:hypothetical protein